jgi:hypothetical protein
VDPVPDPLLLIKSDKAGNRTRTFGFVTRNFTIRQERRSKYKSSKIAYNNQYHTSKHPNNRQKKENKNVRNKLANN